MRATGGLATRAQGAYTGALFQPRHDGVRNRRRANLAKEVGAPGAAKIETADLARKVERLELEAREHEAKVRIIQSRAQLEKLRFEKGGVGVKRT